MKNKLNLLELVKQHKDSILEICYLHKAKDIKVFGSVARGDCDENSDIDFNEIELAGILRYFEIIGEASSSISQDLKNKYLKIPWRLIKDFRNVLVHQYFDIDLQMVENALNKEIPVLK